MASVATKAFLRAYPHENGLGVQLYEEGSYVASNGQLVSLPHTGFRAVAVFTLGSEVPLGIFCEIGPASVDPNPPDQGLIDQSAAALEAYERRTARPVGVGSVVRARAWRFDQNR